jgi:hypothetical protein
MSVTPMANQNCSWSLTVTNIQNFDHRPHLHFREQHSQAMSLRITYICSDFVFLQNLLIIMSETHLFQIKGRERERWGHEK